jgi:hypothetical protein
MLLALSAFAQSPTSSDESPTITPSTNHDRAAELALGQKPEGGLDTSARVTAVNGMCVVTSTGETFTVPDPDAQCTTVYEPIGGAMNSIRYCYERELQKNPALSGRIVVTYAIKPDGSVTAVGVQSETLYNAAVEKCVAGKFERLTYGSGWPTQIAVRFPIEFKRP